MVSERGNHSLELVWKQGMEQHREPRWNHDDSRGVSMRIPKSGTGWGLGSQREGGGKWRWFQEVSQVENERVKWKSILPFFWKVTLPHDIVLVENRVFGKMSNA